MKTRRMGRLWYSPVLLMAVWLSGCPSPTGDGDNGDENGNDNGMGGVQAVGFRDNGLEAPAALASGVENLPPTGDVLAPLEGPALPRGDVTFHWEAADPNETNVDSTLYIGGELDVFGHPLVNTGMRTAPTEVEHRLSVRFPDAGIYYWGVEITDGVNTIRRPVDEVGVMFEISEDATSRIDAEGVVLFCPGASQPARPTTTFSWSLGDKVPTRTQVFVSRAGAVNPFESPMRVYNVPVPTDTARTLSEDEALPLGDELSWGLRIETADEVLFTFEGQVGESFLVAENVPPSGELTGPEDGAVIADETATFALSWVADPGNCEDDLTSTVFLELLDGAQQPSALFESAIQLSIVEGVFQADVVAASAGLNLGAGQWAWGVLADDGTDQTELPHGQISERSFRTFIRDTGPRFIAGPSVEEESCGVEQISGDAIVFSYEDDNGVETVDVTVMFAATEAALFDGPEATLALVPEAADGTAVVFLEALGTLECSEFVHGAGFYGVELDDGVNDPVRGVAEYAGPPTGACCAPDGSCTEGVFEDCLYEYKGDGTTCATVDCPQPAPEPAPEPEPEPEPITDCNENGIADDQDIAEGTSYDCNLNGVPDECEGSPTVVDAGVLAPGIIFDGTYDSVINFNNLRGTICPPQTAPVVEWTLEDHPLGIECDIRSPGSLVSTYLIGPALPGDYVFRLTLLNTGLSDTVTLTLTER